MKHRTTRTSRSLLLGIALLVVAGLAPVTARAATSANATIYNEATVTYDFLTLTNQTATASSTVTVDTLAVAPTVTVDTTAQSTIQGGGVNYVYTVKANSNGPDTYTLTTPITSTDTASAFLSSSVNNPSATSLTLFGGIVVGSGAGYIELPGGSVGGNLTGGEIVELTVAGTSQRYTVGIITAGSPASEPIATNPEVYDQVALAPVGAATALNGSNVVVGAQVGEVLTLTNAQTAGDLDDPTYTSGTHTVNITLTTTATDATDTVVTYTTSGADGNQTVTTVSAPALTVTKIADVASAKPGEPITYTITVTNTSTTTALTNVSLTDAVPTYTSYVANSTRLNGITVAGDGAASPLAAGLDIDDDGGRTPLAAATGTIAAGGVATITFQVTVD